ncbi:uncharacterized protein LOC124178788 isoform X2 [Neodiprion fabricii]|uniref:uncharacterized protein LOC124178788 isoform X2 n=1 Tax=Neodiprion fabricii TaxID=2872261 RepID=UPI001ED966BE|nr:uncharacterized protein LOC124178788 isoform X2 [Neodiprion fabricii]
MNNPYRARPARARVDHAAVSGYGSQSQNTWSSMQPERRSGILPANIYQQQPNSLIQPQQQQQQQQQQQPQQQSHDPWDWGTDNGNNGNSDSWNSNTDQKSESLHQLSQHHQFPSGRTNNSQSIQNPQQGMYYPNFNRNSRPNVLNQQPTSGGNIPRTSLSRESTPSNKDGYNQYTPYEYNQPPQQQQQQQYHLPPRPNSKSSPADHSQWSISSQQTPNLPSLGNNSGAQLDNIKKIQTPPLPPQTNTYNWNNSDQQLDPSLRNWQNHNAASVSGSWQEPSLVANKQQPIENINQSQQGQQTSQTFDPPKEYTSPGQSEYYTNWNSQQHQQSNLTNQWPSNYSRNTSNEATQPILHQNMGTTVMNQWQQPMFQPPVPAEEPVGTQSTPSILNQADQNVPSNQWQPRQPQYENVMPKDWTPAQRPVELVASEKDSISAPHQQHDSLESAKNNKSINDWQHAQSPPSHFASSTGSAVSHTSNTAEQILSGNNHNNERKRSVGILSPSSSFVNDLPIPTKPNAIEKKILDESNWPDGDVNVASNAMAQNNTEADWSTTAEWDTIPTAELSSSFSHLRLSNKSNRQLENQTLSSDMHSSSHSTDGWSSQPISGSENPSDNSPRESVASAQPEPYRDSSERAHALQPEQSLDNPLTTSQFEPQEHVLPQTHQPENSRAAETVPQNAGYDQWYAQRNPVAQSENSWYRNDHQGKSQKWMHEQNIENYENIQQSTEFGNLEVVTPVLQKRNIYGSHDSMNRETLDNEPKASVNQIKESSTPRDFQEDINNVEVPSLLQTQQSLQVEQAPDNYEFASNDRNTFLETGELTDSHQQHEPTPPSQDDENDEVPNDIPFLREVPGQSSNSDPRRNDPTGQEQNIQVGPRSLDPRRNDPSGQEHTVQSIRNINDRTERRDVPPGQERNGPLPSRTDTELPERRNDPSGRERSLPPQPPRNDTVTDNRRNLSETRRNDPSGEECLQSQPVVSEPADLREVPGRGNENEEPVQQADSGLRQIPGGASPSEEIQVANDRDDARVVTGSQEVAALIPASTKHDQSNDSLSKREEAVGASLGESQGGAGQITRIDSYEEGDDEGSGNSRDESRERRRERSPERRGYEYDRKSRYYDRDRDRDFDEEYYYESRRGGDFDRTYNSREDLDRREGPYRDDERRHTSRDDLDRRGRDKDDPDNQKIRSRPKDDLEDRRRRDDDRRKAREELDARGRDTRDYDHRYFRDREYTDRDRRREPDRRGRRYEDYEPRDHYRRDYYEDLYARNSRPSSRSSYNDRDRDYYSRSRDPHFGHNVYGGAYADYGANYGSSYYAYLENMRRTNPAAYMEWYQKYYASQHQQAHAVRGNTSYPEDRASVHSGRSSCDESLCDRTTGDKRTIGDISLLEDTTIGSARLTPTKFSTSHVQASFSTGSLVHVHASYPADGELARVDILRVSSLLAHDPVVRELVAYPGPLIKGVTHKKTIIEYCEAKIKKAECSEDVDDPASYILLYKLMVMLIRQNGNVVGVDIAELLLSNQKSYPYTGKQREVRLGRESVISQKSVGTSGDELNRDTVTPLDTDDTGNLNKPLSTDQVTDHFRELLLYGCGQEALEYAMDKGLWGHALFLASKLDKRTHASVMTRFANGLMANDPLQTLYQLQSGRVPASVTCIAEPKWGDWRPHLAMIISNTSPNPEINRKSITTLGDTLFARNHVHAAHFCYVLAQVDFGPYGMPNSKLVLLGSNPHKPYNVFVTNEAIMLTEIYEYARNLSEPGFTLIDLQTFKYGLAVKLVDYGLTEKALLYIEQIAVNITREPSKYPISFVEKLHNLGDRIKYSDPVCKDSIEDVANLGWLNSLVEILNKYKTGEIIKDGTYDAQNDSTNQQREQYESQQTQQQWVVAQSEYSDGPTSLMEPTTSDVKSDWQPMSLPNTVQDPYIPSGQTSQYIENSVDSAQHQQPQSQVDYWRQQNYTQPEYSAPDYSTEWQQHSEQLQYHNEQPDNTDNVQQEWNYESEKEEKPPTPDVSNLTSTSHSTLSFNQLSGAPTDNCLRQRKPLNNPDLNVSTSIEETCVAQDSFPLLSCVTGFGESCKPHKSLKSAKYPKLSLSYPEIRSGDKINSKCTRVTKIGSKLSKPPSCKPAVFLKCKPKSIDQPVADHNSDAESDDNLQSDNFDLQKKSKLLITQSIAANKEFENTKAVHLSDLDVQINDRNFELVSRYHLTNRNPHSINNPRRDSQSLKQYCNFEEKKVVRVAPHIRSKDIICDTVDAWSIESTAQFSADRSHYKPLIFGGTYPIDMPLRRNAIERARQIRQYVQDGKHISKTFDIDAPTNDSI